MYAIVVPLKVKPEMREKFLAAALDDSTCSRRDEPGCLRFDVLQDNRARRSLEALTEYVSHRRS